MDKDNSVVIAKGRQSGGGEEVKKKGVEQFWEMTTAGWLR